MPAKEPRPANHFKLILGGNETVGVFREVSLGTSETDVVDHKYVDEQGKPTIRRVPGHGCERGRRHRGGGPRLTSQQSAPYRCAWRGR